MKDVMQKRNIFMHLYVLLMYFSSFPRKSMIFFTKTRSARYWYFNLWRLQMIVHCINEKWHFQVQYLCSIEHDLEWYELKLIFQKLIRNWQKKFWIYSNIYVARGTASYNKNKCPLAVYKGSSPLAVYLCKGSAPFGCIYIH